MPRQRLTANFVERVHPDPDGRQTDYTDTWRPRPGVTFGLRVGKRSKAFQLFYRANGRWQRLTLGRYHAYTFTLADAHDEAVRRVNEVVEGHDPAARRRAEKAAGSVSDLADRYVSEYARPRKRTWKKDKALLDTEVLPEWGSWKAHEVSPEHVDALVSKLAKRAPVKANRVLAVIRKMFAWAASPGRRIVRYNPAAGIEAPGQESSRDRVYSDAEIAAMWRRYDDLTPLSRDCLRVVAATAQRPGEVMRMRKGDIEGRWWTIPAADAKNGLSHRVYLSDPAWAIIEPRKAGESAFIFPSPTAEGDTPIGTLQKAQERAREARKAKGDDPGRDAIADARIHDWRRTAASRMASKGYSRHVIGRVLNHAEHSVTAVYDRYGYDDEKQAALDTWAAELQRVVK